MARSRIVVIGAGHNGLVAAAYLAKAGHAVTVLERADAVGGILRGSELAPGFRAPGVAHTVGRLRASVVQELRLERHGLELLAPAARLFAPLPDGGSVTFWGDPARTAEELRERSPHDAAAFVPFDRKVRAIGGLLDRVHRMTPPELSGPTVGDVLAGARLGLAFRRLGTELGREAIRWMPMAVADLLQETFEDEGVRGPLATRGVVFTAMGPWSAGTAAVFLNDSAGNDGGAAGTAVVARGGTEAVAAALRAAPAPPPPPAPRSAPRPRSSRSDRGTGAPPGSRSGMGPSSTPTRSCPRLTRSGRSRCAIRSSWDRRSSGTAGTSVSRARRRRWTWRCPASPRSTRTPNACRDGS